MNNSLQVDYEQLEADRLAHADLALKKELEDRRTSSGGNHNTLRQVILRQVSEENYERAVQELKDYIQFRKDYMNFVVRSNKYVEHCLDLIQAISTKRQFRQLQSLSFSKQQEFHDKVLEHFDELKDYLKQIESVEREVKLDDIRSTIWVIQTFAQCVIGIVLLAFFLDMTGGIADSFITVMNKLINDGADWLVNLF